ncbi:MAG: YafY family transcriptional regulator [Bacteroidetes bacterium]|nr:YafY family transcriptional regulator [Bacteroidota bacterium]
MNRIDRLTAILIQLQTKKVVKAEEIADRFEISLRTVYRDVKALMEAGVPIGSEAGTGYFIVDGYHLPPVMFTQDEASSMLLAGKLVEKMADKSVRTAYESAMHKIKCVLKDPEKDHLENLESHIEVYLRSRSDNRNVKDFPDHFMVEIQKAAVNHHVLNMEYSDMNDELTMREIEPIGLFYYSMAWHLIGWCRLRNGYRDFRADRIKSLVNTHRTFEARNLMSLQEYFQSIFQTNNGLVRAVVTFDKGAIRNRPLYGSIAQTEVGDRMRAEFMMDSMMAMAKWLLMFGSKAEVEEPEELKSIMQGLVHDLHAHYLKEARVES